VPIFLRRPAFTVLLPLAGIVGIPFVGKLLDTRPTIETSWILLVFGASFGILTIIPRTVPQLIGIGVLVFNRPLLYTYLSDLFAKVFGFQTFGKVYGLAMTLSGIVGLLLTPFDIFTKTHGGNFTPINIALMIAGFVTNVGLTAKLYFHVRKGRIALPYDDH
jgi:MFS family permease